MQMTSDARSAQECAVDRWSANICDSNCGLINLFLLEWPPVAPVGGQVWRTFASSRKYVRWMLRRCRSRFSCGQIKCQFECANTHFCKLHSSLGRSGARAHCCAMDGGALVTRIEWNGNEMWHSSALLYTRARACGRLKGLCAQTLMQMCQFHTSYVSIKLYTLARTHIYFPSSSSIAPSH